MGSGNRHADECALQRTVYGMLALRAELPGTDRHSLAQRESPAADELRAGVCGREVGVWSAHRQRAGRSHCPAAETVLRKLLRTWKAGHRVRRVGERVHELTRRAELHGERLRR